MIAGNVSQEQIQGMVDFSNLKNAFYIQHRV